MSTAASSHVKALIFGCSLKPSPSSSSTDKLANELIAELNGHSVESELIRVADYVVKPGVKTDMGDGDAWPQLRKKMLNADIVIIATPTWAGQLSSIAMRVIERLDAELSQTSDDGLPLVYGKVAGAVVVGNEDGAHHICATIYQALNDYGFTIPAASATYWNGEAMHKTDYKDLESVPESTASATKQMAANLAHTATLLKNQPYSAA
ncbi:MAG: flavodoxin family protein [Chloroflexi bacterium]|nr:MAG: flavodoxin family protein [Chloroflexota bacterium]